MKWRRQTERDRMRRQGTLDVNDESDFLPPVDLAPKAPPPDHVSKDELRRRAAEAFAEWKAKKSRKRPGRV